MSEIRFYRHGETEWNKVGRLQGWLDSPLTEAGKEAAARVQWQPDLVFCSDLPRAYETARLMFPECELTQSAALREICLGDWQGRYIKDLQQDMQYMRYLHSPEQFRPATQECFDAVTERMLQFYRQLEPNKKIAIVSHGVAIACLTVALQDKPRAQLWDCMLAGCDWIGF